MKVIENEMTMVILKTKDPTTRKFVSEHCFCDIQLFFTI